MVDPRMDHLHTVARNPSRGQILRRRLGDRLERNVGVDVGDWPLGEPDGRRDRE